MTRLRLFAFLSIWFCAATAQAETPPLPAPDEVAVIALKPQAKSHPVFFTEESLRAALPHLVPATLMPPIGGKIWQQSGVLVLKDGGVLFWRAYRDDVLVIETGGEPRVYALDR